MNLGAQCEQLARPTHVGKSALVSKRLTLMQYTQG
jgi:hypothetical protein